MTGPTLNPPHMLQRPKGCTLGHRSGWESFSFGSLHGAQLEDRRVVKWDPFFWGNQTLEMYGIFFLEGIFLTMDFFGLVIVIDPCCAIFGKLWVDNTMAPRQLVYSGLQRVTNTTIPAGQMLPPRQLRQWPPAKHFRRSRCLGDYSAGNSEVS